MTMPSPTPQVAISPFPALSSNGWEISVPFRIDPSTGGVAVATDDLDIINQHLMTIIYTEVGERLMLPTYGSMVPSQVFEPNYNTLGPFLVQDLQDAIQRWEPSVKIQSIKLNPQPGSPSLLSISIDYTYSPFNDLNSVNVNLGGSTGQVVSL